MEADSEDEQDEQLHLLDFYDLAVPPEELERRAQRSSGRPRLSSQLGETESQQVDRLAEEVLGPAGHQVAATRASAVAEAWQRAAKGYDSLGLAAANASELRQLHLLNAN